MALDAFGPVVPTSSTLSTMRRCALFSALDETALTDIAARTEAATFKQGEVVIRQGENSPFLRVLSEGLLKMYITAPSGSRMILDLIRPGDSFGLDMCIGGSASQATVDAVATSQVVLLEGGEFLRLARSYSPLLTSTIASMAGLIQRRTSQVTDLVFLELHQRIAKLLLGLLPASKAEDKEESVVTLRLTLPDLAAVVGGEPDAVREAVLTFQELGYIELLGGRGIAIRHPEALRDHLSKGGSWAQLTQRTFHDVLTGLPNRAFFHMRASSALTRHQAAGQIGAVLFVDLDDFKKVNDTMGHAAGDELLIQVVQRLRESIRPSDTPARFGGDEFGILLEDMRSIDNAAVIAQRVVDSLKQPFRLSGGHASVQASVGVAVFEGSDNITIEALIEIADKAMYAAKQLGKGRYVVYGADVIR
jgi:diguanylate cyclase (GGDEF)-like protein